MKKIFTLSGCFFCVLISFWIGDASAEIIWDYSPDATHASIEHAWYTNQAAYQHLAEKVVFSNNTAVGGMDIYSSTEAGVVGQLVKIHIWSDSSGVPNALLYDFNETISTIDNAGATSQTSVSRKHVDFSEPINLTPGTYWVGMSSATESSLGQATIETVDDGEIAWFNNSVFVALSADDRGDMAFRLHGIKNHTTWMIDTIDDSRYFKLETMRSIAVDSEGIPHIVYGGDHLYHAYYDGSFWQEEMIDSASGVGVNASIAIDASDKIHICYENHLATATSTAKYKYASNVSGSWIIEALDFIPKDTDDLYTRYPRMAVDSSGKAHLAYTQGIYNVDHYDYEIIHATNSSGEWMSEISADNTDENPAASGEMYDLAIADDGSVHILIKMWPDIKYVTNSSGSWLKEKVVSVWNAARGAAICIDSGGTVHVAYGAQHGSIGDNYMLKYAFRGAAGWVTDTAAIDPINIANAVGNVSIDVDNLHVVHVSYLDTSTNYLKYAKGTADSWTVENVAAITNPSPYSFYNSTAVSDSGIEHIGYWDNANSAVKYASKATGTWTIQNVQSGSADLVGISMAPDSSGIIHVSYYDTITGQLRYAAGTYGSWSLETLSNSGIGNKLAIGPYDDIQIISRDKTSGKGRHISNSSGSWQTTVLDFEWRDWSIFSIDEAGKMHVNYTYRSGGVYPDTSPSYTHIMYGAADTPDGPWSIVEVKLATTTIVPYLPEYISFQSMVIDQAGKAHIIYVMNDTDLIYTTNATGTWTEEKIVSLTGDDWFSDPQIAVDISGKAHVVYFDSLNDDWDYTRLVYINNVSGSWGLADTVAESDNGFIGLSAVAFDSSGQLHISYPEFGVGLIHSVGSNGSWTSSVVDATPSISAHDMKIDSFDNVHIVYREYGDRDIKYATTSPNDELGPGGTDSSYDGNSDGIPDTEQDNVASFHAYDGMNYFTLASPTGTIIQNVQPVDNPSPINTPEGIEFPFGFVNFIITGSPPGEPVTLHLYLHESSSPSTYWQYGPTPDNPYPHWYEFLYDGTTGAEFAGNKITLHFVDGLRGDHDLTANGTIVDPGAPGFSQSVPGDLDGDGDVDRNDVNIIASYRNQPASFCPDCDVDGDGIITILDMRTLMGMCSFPRCAVQ